MWWALVFILILIGWWEFASQRSVIASQTQLPAVALPTGSEVAVLAGGAFWSAHRLQVFIDVLTNHKALRCERVGDRKSIVVENQEVEKRLEFDALLCAVGRVARLKGYGLEALGIPTQRTVAVNDYLETLYPNICAAGDVAGRYQLTHTAAHMACYAAVNALFGTFRKFKVD